VVLTGELADPRPAYAAADVVLGMGGSAIRALAFGKPLVVQGEGAFWALLTPETAGTFLHQGWYGVGDGRDSHQRLGAVLDRLAGDPDLRVALGRFGRRLAVDRFSLEAAARVQTEVYREALAGLRTGLRTCPSLARSAGGLLAHKVRDRRRQLVGSPVRDDFNAQALARAALSAPSPATGPAGDGSVSSRPRVSRGSTPPERP
jgi:hypothetical protein